MALFPRLPRGVPKGSARGILAYIAAGALSVPLAELAAAGAGPLAPVLRLGLGFVLVGAAAALLHRLLRLQARRLRQANELLDRRNQAQSGALHREVASRAAAEKALRLAESRFRDIAEAAPDFLWELGPDLRFLYLSKRFSEETGLPVDSLLGHAVGEVLQPLTADGVTLSGWLVSRRPFRAVPVVLAAGSVQRVLALSGRPVFDGTGAFGGFRGTGADITERRRQELSVERLRRRQELILDSLGEGVFGLDREGRFTFINPAAQEMLGWTIDELLGRVANEKLQPDPPDGLAPTLGGESRRRRSGATLRRKDGSELPVDYVWAALMEDGKPIGAVVALRDITDQQRIDRELIFAKERAEAATRTKSEFLAHMSHELRTPLNSIIGFADVMIGEYFGPVGNDRYKDYIADIRRSGGHLLDMINDVVDLARIEAGKMDLDEHPCDLAQLVEEALAMVRPLAVPSSLLLINNVPGNLPELRLDPRRMKQVLLNLLSNAVRFTPPEGSVTVQAQVAADGTCRLEIQDTGIGIPADEIDKVTQVFVQGNNAVVREKGGAGLGLPLAQQLVERHGGRLEIVSQSGQGTTVSIILPPSRLVGSPPPPAGG